MTRHPLSWLGNRNPFDRWWDHVRDVHSAERTEYVVDMRRATAPAIVVRCTGCDWFVWRS